MTRRFGTGVWIIAVFVLCRVLAPSVAEAGCGCEKAPPDAASVRPNATYAGQEVTIFHPTLQVGQTYTVEFLSGTSSASASVETVAVERRDLADGVYRPQLNVVVPEVPLGPTAIEVFDAVGSVLLLTDSALTVVADPLVVPSVVGLEMYPGYRAAVGRDGTVYVALDLSQVQQPRVIRAQALGYPLRVTNDDVAFFNVQGFLMQLLGENMPGLYSIAAADAATNSDVLQYSRHEFHSWFLRHDERQLHGIDPSDQNWHLDGTPHINHDHLILAIAGVLDGGASPAPGATPPFTLKLGTRTLFHHGLVATGSLFLGAGSSTDSYDSRDGPYGFGGNVGSQGDVRVGTELEMDRFAHVQGDATAASFNIDRTASVAGSAQETQDPVAFLPVEIPAGLEDLGSLRLSRGEVVTLIGPGSFRLSEIHLSQDSELIIDNAQGPVTLYVDGNVFMSSHRNSSGGLTTVDSNPENFAIYVTAGSRVNLTRSAGFQGVVYAPECQLDVASTGEYFGSFVGGDVRVMHSSNVHFDTSLRGR